MTIASWPAPNGLHLKVLGLAEWQRPTDVAVRSTIHIHRIGEPAQVRGGVSKHKCEWGCAGSKWNKRTCTKKHVACRMRTCGALAEHFSFGSATTGAVRQGGACAALGVVAFATTSGVQAHPSKLSRVRRSWLALITDSTESVRFETMYVPCR
jgi:hypothetical protein